MDVRIGRWSGWVGLGVVVTLACSLQEGGLPLAVQGDEGESKAGSPPGRGFTPNAMGGARDSAPPAIAAQDAARPDAPLAPPPPDAAVPAPDPAPLPPPPLPPPPLPPPLPPSPAPDAAPAPPPGGGTIACGSAVCGPGQACCASLGGVTCIPQNGVCLGAVRRCDGPEDCVRGPQGEEEEESDDGDRVCCARAELVGGYRAQCTKAGDCNKQGGAPVCRTAADCRRDGDACTPTGNSIDTCTR